MGLVTDIHYCDGDTRINRFYRESLAKLDEAVRVLRDSKVDVALELGDLVDVGPKPDPEAERTYLRTIDAVFAKVGADRHYVLGNHCVATLTKVDFLATVGKKRSWYSLKRNGVTLVVLDGCFRSDGVAYGEGRFDWKDTDIPLSQRRWLARTLKQASGPVVVFVHQRLDTPLGSPYTIQSAQDVRCLLEESGKVSLVVMGHSHGNALSTINGISYVTLAAMVEGSGLENSGYSKLQVFSDGTFELEGFRKHAKHPVHRKRLGA